MNLFRNILPLHLSHSEKEISAPDWYFLPLIHYQKKPAIEPSQLPELSSIFKERHADFIWIEGKGSDRPTLPHLKNEPLTPYLLGPRIQFPHAVFLRASWFEEIQPWIKTIHYPFDLFWFALLRNASISVHTVPALQIPPSIQYRLNENLPFGPLEPWKRKMIAYHNFFHGYIEGAGRNK